MRITALGSLSLSIVAFHFASGTQAAVQMYDGTGGSSNFDVAYSAPGGVATTLSTGDLSLGTQAYSNSAFIGPYYTPSASDARYYGGTIAYTQGNGAAYYAPDVAFTFKGGGDSIALTNQSAKPSFWIFSGYSNPGYLTSTAPEYQSGGTTFPSTTASMNFVIKVFEEPNGQVGAAFFFGSKATASTESATPDFVTVYDPASYNFGINNIPSLSTLNISLSAYEQDTTPSSLTTSNFFGANAWTPVSVPEPGALCVLAGGGLAMAARRIRRR